MHSDILILGLLEIIRADILEEKKQQTQSENLGSNEK